MSALVNKKRDSELRNAAKAFVTSFYGAVATSDEEVRRIFQRPGWSLFHGGIVELTDEVTTALSRLAARAAKLLGPSGGNEKATRELALKEAQNSFTNKVPVEDAVTRLIDKIFDQGTAQFEFLVPNYLLLFGDNIRSIEIGRVRAAFTAELATEFAERAPNQRFRVIPGQSFSLQFVGDVVHVEMFPIAWLVSVSAAKENVEEEAKWLIDVALSFLRLHYKQEGARFPTNGAIEPHPLRLKNIDNVGVKIQGTTAHLGGGSVPPAYEITAEIQAIAADPAFQDKARLIFDPPEKSVAARVSRGLGWLTRGRQAEDRAERLLYFFTAIESLLSNDDKTAPVIQTIARHAAVLLSDDINIRVKLSAEIRKLYTIRSTLVHGGVRGVLWDAVNTAQYLAELMFARILEVVDLSSAHATLCDDLAKASFGLPWPTPRPAAAPGAD